MLGPLTELLCQLERKRKYRWSFGTGTNRVLAVAKGLILLAALCLIYIAVYSALDLGTNGGNHNFKIFGDKSSSLPMDDPLSTGYHYGQLRNSIWNGDKKDDLRSGDAKNGETIAAKIINSLARNFYKADKDGNGLLDEKELATYVKDAIEAHLEKAMKDNFDHYFRIDKEPRNGLVHWDEYLAFFFENRSIKGVTPDDVRNRTPPFMALPKDIKVEIARIQASWSEAASNNPEFLTVDEFLAFEHPEASPTKIISYVDEIFATFDLDADDIITEEELTSTYKHAEGVDPIFQLNKHAIDADGNGQITRIELMRYLDPRSEHHSMTDAKQLMKAADKNNDGRLTMLELLKSANKVVKSKFYNIGSSLHNH